MPALFAVTLFVSATLLFMVQPMVGKKILPLLGGSPAAWNTCMVFFQGFLLLGYLYAHKLTSKYSPIRQVSVHLVVLVGTVLAMLALAFFSPDGSPVAVFRVLAPQGQSYPMFGVMVLLFVAIGLPFLVVSTSAPLLQRWFNLTGHPSSKDPYFLYAASNAGSLISLLGYPFLIEPHLSLANQAWVWAGGFILLVGLIYFCGKALNDPTRSYVKPKNEPAKTSPTLQQSNAPGWTDKIHWMALAFVPSSLMLGVTFHMTTDIASVPLLWVIPLALYLLTFIIAYAHQPTWYRPVLANLSPVLSLLLVFVLISNVTADMPTFYALLLHLVVYFFTALLMHSELARLRPHPSYLTNYFLWISIGGVMGGIFNALIAPVLLPQSYEYPIAIAIGCLLVPILETKLPVASAPLAAKSIWTIRWLKYVYCGSAIALILLARSMIALEWLQPNECVILVMPIILCTTIALGLLLCMMVSEELSVGRPRIVWAFDIIFPALIFAVVSFLTVMPAKITTFQSECQVLTDWCTATYYGHPPDQLETRISSKIPILLTIYALPCMLCFFFIDRPIRFGLCVASVLFVCYFRSARVDSVEDAERSFFGILRVEKYNDPKIYTYYYKDDQGELNRVFIVQKQEFRRLYHGTTLHGIQAAETAPTPLWDEVQFLIASSPWDTLVIYGAEKSYDLRQEPLTYYHRSGPVGDVFIRMRSINPTADIAMVGLGTGSASCYALPGQSLTFYEIDPTVQKMVEGDKYFSYVTDARRRGANVDIILGDARLNLNPPTDESRRQPHHDRKFGILLLDAFSSDSIPIHLLTKEAMDLYKSRLTEHGILAVHISNRYIDLEPVVQRLAEKCKLVARVWNDGREAGHPGKTASSWVVLAKNYEDLGMYLAGDDFVDENDKRHFGTDTFVGAIGGGCAWSTYESHWKELKEFKELRTWTDDYSDVLAVMRLEEIKSIRRGLNRVFRFFGMSEVPILPSKPES